MYKALQAIVEREHGFSSDQNVMVLRLVADSLELRKRLSNTVRHLDTLPTHVETFSPLWASECRNNGFTMR